MPFLGYTAHMPLFFRISPASLQRLFRTQPKIPSVLIIRPKKVVLFPEIGRVGIFLSLTRPHNRMCIGIYIFNFKKKTSKKIPQKKNTKEEKIISPENRLKKQICGRPVKIFLVTRISGNSIVFSFYLLILIKK